VEPSAYATLVHKFQEQQKAAGMASHDLWEDPISIIQQQQEQQGVKFQFEITWNPSQPWGSPSGQEVVQVLHESLKRRCVCCGWWLMCFCFAAWNWGAPQAKKWFKYCMKA